MPLKPVGDEAVSVASVVGSLPATFVPLADLTNPDSKYNQPHLSGKRRGSTFLTLSGGKLVFAVATGSDPRASWTLVGSGSGGGGGVATVNNKNPDGNGNVQLTADDVGAYSKALGQKLATVTNPSDLGFSSKADLDSNFNGMDFNAAVNAMDTIYRAKFPNSEMRITYMSWVLGEYPHLESAILPDNHITDANTNLNLIVFGQSDPTGNTVNMTLAIQTAPAVVGQGALRFQEWVATVFVPESLKSKALWHLSAGEGSGSVSGLIKSKDGNVVVDGIYTIGVTDGNFDGLTIEQAFALVSRKWDEYLATHNYQDYGTRTLHTVWRYRQDGIPHIEDVMLPPNGSFADSDVIRFEVRGDKNTVYAKLDNITQNKSYVMSFRKADIAQLTTDWWREIHTTEVGGTLGGLSKIQADKLYVGLTGDQHVGGSKTYDNHLDLANGASIRTDLTHSADNSYRDTAEILKATSGDDGRLEIGSNKADARLFTKDSLIVEKADGSTVDLLAGASGGGLTQAEADKRYLNKAQGGTVQSDVIVRGEVASESLEVSETGKVGLAINPDESPSGLIPVGTNGIHQPAQAMFYDHAKGEWVFPIVNVTDTLKAGRSITSSAGNDIYKGDGVRSIFGNVKRDLHLKAPTNVDPVIMQGTNDPTDSAHIFKFLTEKNTGRLPTTDGEYVMKVSGQNVTWDHAAHPPAPQADGDYTLRVAAHKKTWERVASGAGAQTGSHDVHVIGMTKSDGDERYVKKSDAFKQNKADALYFKKSGGVIDGETSVRDMFTANEVTAQTHGRTGVAMGGNYEESGIVPLDMGGHHVPKGLLHYDHARGIWLIAGKPIQLETGKDIVPSFLAYLNKDEEIYVKIGEVNNTSKGKMWFGNIVTGISPAMTADASTKTYTVKQLRGINQDVGTDYLLSLRVGMIGTAPSDGAVRVYFFDEIDGIVTDKTGQPLVVEKHFTNGEKLGKLEITGVMNVQGTKTFSCHIVDSFTGNIRITQNDETPSGLMVQGLTSEVKTGDGFLQYQLDSGETINLRSHYLGEDNFLADFTHEPEQASREISTATNTHITGGMVLNNLAPVMMGVQDGSLNIVDAGEMYDYNLVKFFDSQDTYDLRGETITAKAKLRERKSPLKLALLKWTGTPNAYNRGVYNVREHGNPVLASGWSIVGELSISATSDGETTVHKDFVIPDDANNFAIMLYPAQESIGNQLALDSIGMDVQDHFVAYSIKPNKIAGQEYLKFSKLHKSFRLTSGDLSFVRYTIGMNRTPIQVGYEISGKADVVAATLDGSHNKGVLEFNRTGTAHVNASVLIRNETASKNEVHIWWELLKDGALTNVENGAIDSYIEAKNSKGVYYALPEITVPVVAGTKLVLCAQSNMADGMYIQANYNGLPAVETEVRFTELQ